MFGGHSVVVVGRSFGVLGDAFSSGLRVFSCSALVSTMDSSSSGSRRVLARF